MEAMTELPPYQNPYQVPATLESSATVVATRDSYGGIGRLAYFGLTMLIAIVYQAFAGAIRLFVQVEFGVFAILPILVIYVGALMYLVALRNINMGFSPWWCIGIIIPLLNILVGVRCLICPEGYADHKKLDRPAIIVLSVLFSLLLLVIILTLSSILLRT